MNIEYFQNNQPQLKVSLEFLEKWGDKVENLFKNWANKSSNKRCINEFNKPKKDIDIEIMSYVENKFKIITGKNIDISNGDEWIFNMNKVDLNNVFNILSNLPNCSYFENIISGKQVSSENDTNNVKGYQVSKDFLEKFYRKFGLDARKWQNNPINSPCVNDSNKILPKFTLYMDRYFEYQIEKQLGKKISFRKFKWLKTFSENDFNVLLQISRKVPNCLKLKKIYGNDVNSEQELGSMGVTSENIIDDSESDPKNLLIRKISALKEKYVVKNKKCFKSFDSNKTIYAHFLRGYQKYLEHGFKNHLNKVPTKSSEDNMSYKELNVYYSLLKKLPNCNVLISEGSIDIDKTIDYRDTKIFDTIGSEESDNTTSEESDNTTSENSNIVSGESTSINKKRNNSVSEIVKKFIKPSMNDKFYKKPSLPGVGSTTTITSITKDNPPSITTVLHKNRGRVVSNPFGKRQLKPNSAPYLKYVEKIGQHLQNINISVKNVGKKIDNREEKEEKFIESMKNLMTEKEINDKIMSEESSNNLNNPNDKIYQEAKTNDFKLLSHNTPNKVVSMDKNQNIGYRTNIKFNHLEPTKKIMSAYGWSYMPPQSWSVPQKRPPVCIPSKENRTKIMPLLDKGVPVNALDWTKVGSILPKFEYSEHYNPDYYYPGWKSQKNIKYPNFTTGKNFSNKYYNYNRAEKTSKQ